MSTSTETGATGYDNRISQEMLDFIDLRISGARESIQRAQSTLSDCKECQADMDELRARAIRGLSGPPEKRGRSLRDKEDAEAKLAELAEVMKRAEDELSVWGKALAKFEAERKAFPHEELRAQRRLEVLRQQLKRRLS